MEFFKDRIDEGAVARILQLIAETPNRRERPITGDLTGAFDFWFDGGAGRNITGWTEYKFADGARATVSVTPALSVAIKFQNGCYVAVTQELEVSRAALRDYHLD